MRKIDLKKIFLLRPSLNITLAVTYVLLIIFALTVVSFSVTQYVGKYLLKQRRNTQMTAIDDCSRSITPFLPDMDINSIYTLLSDCAIQQNGRILFVDKNNVIQSDTFNSLNGTVPDCAELTAVLNGSSDSSTGYHRLRLSETAVTTGNQYLSGTSAKGRYWAAYYAIAVTVNGKVSGAILLISPVQDVIDDISVLENNMLLLSSMFTLITGAVTFYIFHRLTTSFRNFNRAISTMAGGDFSTRVSEKEFAELGDMARAFNGMSKRLETLETSRSQFVSDASHELKTPLASMKVLSDSLLSSPDTPTELYREFLTDINHEIDRLNLIINDLLTLVRMDRGNELEAMPVELGGLIERVVTTVMPLAENKHIALRYDYASVTAWVDELRMQQVLTNLIDNAIKYSAENTEIRISLTQTIGNFIISVEDHGIGISSEHLPHLFERFYRVDKARSRQTGGTGLGLAIVKQIVEQHGGHIEVRSALGEGSIFTVTIPLGANKPSQKEEPVQ